MGFFRVKEGLESLDEQIVKKIRDVLRSDPVFSNLYGVVVFDWFVEDGFLFVFLELYNLFFKKFFFVGYSNGVVHAFVQFKPAGHDVHVIFLKRLSNEKGVGFRVFKRFVEYCKDQKEDSTTFNFVPLTISLLSGGVKDEVKGFEPVKLHSFYFSVFKEFPGVRVELIPLKSGSDEPFGGSARFVFYL